MAEGFVLEGTFDDRGILEGLRKLPQAAAAAGAQAGAAFQKGITDAGKSSTATLIAELDRLQRRQLRISSDNTALEKTKARIKEIETQLSAVGQKPISLKADTKTLDGLRSKLTDLQSELDKTAIGSKRFQELQRDIKGVEGQIDTATGKMSLLSKAGAAVAGYLSVQALSGFVQSLASVAMESESAEIRLKALTGRFGETAQAQEVVAAAAKTLNLSQTEASNGFSQLYAALRPTGVSLANIETVFVGVTAAAKNTGLSAESVNNALVQLTQGLASGALQGDELRSVLEQLPPLSQAIASTLGVSVGQLKKLGSEGKITTEVIVKALEALKKQELGSLDKTLESTAEKTKALGNAWQAFQVDLGKNLLGLVADGAGSLAKALEFVTNNTKTLVKTLGAVGAFVGTLGALANASWLLAQAQRAIAVGAAAWQALLSPAGIAKVGIALGVAAGAGFLLDKAMGSAGASSAELGKQAQQQASAAVAGATATGEAVKQLTQGEKDRLAVQAQQLQASVAGLQLEQSVSAAQKARLENSISLLDAIVARQQAVTNLEQAGNDVLLARNSYLLSQTKNEAAKAQLLKEQKALEAQALAAQITGLGQKFAAERQSLDLKQKMATLEQQMAEKTAQRALVEAQMAFIKAQQAGKSGEELALAQSAVDLASGQLDIERQRSGLLGTTQALERETLSLNQKTEATKLRAQAAGKGMEQSLSSQLGLLDQSLSREGQRASTAQQLVDAQNANALAVKAAADAEKAHLAAYTALDQARRSGDPAAVKAALDLLGAREQDLFNARGVVQATANQVSQQQAVVRQMEQAGIAADGVLGAVNDTRQEQQKLNTAAGGLDQRYGDASRQAGRLTASIQGSGKESRILISNIKDVGRISTTAAGQAKTIAQGLQYSARGAGAITKSDFSGQFEEASTGAVGIAESGIDTTVGRAANQTQALTYGMSQAASEAESFYRWLAQASGLPNARWAGGPVEGGAQYRVNELGQEAFLANSGRLALINRAANSTWTAPSSGVVIPAGLTSQLQEQGLVGPGVSRNLSQARPARSGDSGLAASVARQSVAISQLSAEVRELRRKDWSVNVKLRGDGHGLSYLNSLNSML